MSFTTIEHDSPEWHALRARHVGGSEIAALFDLASEDTPNYLRSRFALWHIKSGRVPEPKVDNPRADWGLMLEVAIAAGAAKANNWSIRKGGYVEDNTCPGLGCTLDFIIDEDPEEEGPGDLEIKNVDWMVHKRSWTGDEPPPHILLQHQHQLAATGHTWGAVVALVGGNDLRTYRYKARPKLIEDIRRRVREFWASIDAGKEPPVDGSDSASAVLAALYPEIVDDAVDMRESNEWAEAAHGLYMAAEARRAANDDYDLAKNRVVKLLDGHKRGWGNGWAVNTSITAENPGKAITEAEVGKIVGKRKESRSYTAKEMTT
jgi:predicted phage-related endonuclease